jgi:hypothetical protein
MLAVAFTSRYIALKPDPVRADFIVAAVFVAIEYDIALVHVRFYGHLQ